MSAVDADAVALTSHMLGVRSEDEPIERFLRERLEPVGKLPSIPFFEAMLPSTSKAIDVTAAT